MRSKSTPLNVPTILLLLILTACTPDEPEATQIPIARASATPFATATYTAVPTTTETTPTTAVLPTTPTFTPAPTQTAVPLPLPSLAPFPTVTPDYTFWYGSPDSFARSIFVQLSYYGGDGAISELEIPTLIIYSDGQLLYRESWNSYQYWETRLTALEMCTLKQEIEATGFLEPRSEEVYYIEESGGDGAGYDTVLVEDKFYSFYDLNRSILIEELASGLELIQNYQPPGQTTPYIPTAYAITIFEDTDMYEYEDVPEWPSNLPPLSELWPDRSQTGQFVLEGELAAIFHVINQNWKYSAVRDNDHQYIVYSRQILPHETPYHQAYFFRTPKNYTPGINCDSEPTFLPLPTLTPPLVLPALSAQGRIAFVSQDQFHVSQEIFISDADGTNRFQLTNNRGYDGETAWSPNGQKIAFTSDRNGNLDIFVMDIHGRNVIQLTTSEADDLSPTWSPDGTKIAFTSIRLGNINDTEIYLINPDGTAEEQLTSNQIREHHPVFSPDGRKIAFVLEEALFNEKLAILSLDTGQIEILTPDAHYSLSRPAWFADSTRLAIAIDGNNQETEIRIINTATHQIENQQFLPPYQFPKTLSWSSQGNFIIFDAWFQTEGEPVNLSESTAHLGSFNLYALDTTTNQIIQITYNQTDETLPSLWP